MKDPEKAKTSMRKMTKQEAADFWHRVFEKLNKKEREELAKKMGLPDPKKGLEETKFIARQQIKEHMQKRNPLHGNPHRRKPRHH